MGQVHFFLPFILALSFLSGIGLSQNPQQPISNVGSSGQVNLKYHMGPVLAPPIHLYTIWYGNWDKAHQAIIRSFLMSLHPSNTSSPSVSDWWRTVRLYTDQTDANVTGDILLRGEHYDDYSHGKSLTRLTVQSIIKKAIEAQPKPLPLDTQGGLYLLLTSGDVEVAEFCRAVCGFHSFTFPAVVGAVVPYAWVGYSGPKCPGMCGYPKEMQKFDSGAPAPSPTGSGGQGSEMGPPNGDVGADGMVSIIAHELAESATNPLNNAWYAGDEPTSPNEVADLCLGVYGSGAGGGYIGMVSKDSEGRGYNVNGLNGKKFLVQWIWDPIRQRCFGPNAQN